MFREVSFTMSRARKIEIGKFTNTNGKFLLSKPCQTFNEANKQSPWLSTFFSVEGNSEGISEQFKRLLFYG